MKANIDPDRCALVKTQGSEPPYFSEIPFGVFLSVMGPFALLVALALALGAGLLHETQADYLWAINTAQTSSGGRFPPLTDSTVITLHRSICGEGWCPEYTVRLSGSGKVEYDGRAFVCEYGVRIARANPRAVTRLVQAMVATGYFGYSWPKGEFWTDAHTAVTSLRHDGRFYAISHYHGDDGAPKWLRSMEGEIDRVAGTVRWLPIRGKNGIASCPTPYGRLREVARVARPAAEPTALGHAAVP